MTELLAPVSSLETLTTALESGADAVYFGVSNMNMRRQAGNFELNQLPGIVKKCRKHNAKAFITLNTIAYDEDLEKAERIISASAAAGVDAIICWDQGIMSLVKKHGIDIHLSTQASVANFEALRFYNSLGVKRFVLARELSLANISKIASRIKDEDLDAELESFVHGAMCVSVSGRCFISHFLTGCSANRGECLQHCRRQYSIKDLETGDDLIVGNNFVLSPKDLCALPILPELINSGIKSFKIEGRMKSSDYIRKVVSIYREGLDLIKTHSITETNNAEWLSFVEKSMPVLESVFNRGFHTGFYERPPYSMITDEYGSRSKTTKHYVGIVKRYLKRISVIEVQIHSHGVKLGDTLAVAGKSTGFKEFTLKEMQMNDQNITEAQKGDFIGIKIDFPVRPRDKVFKFITRQE